ncbi:class I SAM-dependent rRNA methyltransferase [Paraliomyxa miuraensis]|uniref:class I SAM-dependent rRNA methyltransferase n=1 Tax=Paraliomyxa miuraensis TaxID=376150 RepID=UPI00224F9724|nr:class I SAM-dependent methyltransferase [Paraliomyxa miuraensis]MCX4246045.1 class I SAM-dependent methyltransferase [Paraliomyxa miuraensis]
MSTRIQLRRDAGKVGPTHGPWIRTRQVARILGVPDPGELAAVEDRHGEVLGWGLVSERSSITVRMLQWGAEPPPPQWLSQRLTRAFEARQHLGLQAQPTTGMRMVNSEGDGLPGLVIDRYDTQLVVQIATAPMAARRHELMKELRTRFDGPVHVVRPESAAKTEGFEPGIEREGEHGPLCFVEHGLRLSVPAPPSQKTGAYFDQRANRREVARLAAHAEGPLLDLGCHVGGFALHAAAAGVPAVGVDRSASMLERAAAHATMNHLPGLQWVEADMFGVLDDPRLAGPFGTIVVDPPKIAARRRDVDRAAEAMQRMVARVAARLRVGGHLVLCSCSHHVGSEHLDRFVLASPGSFTRVALRGADLDHPIAPGHIEGEYLRVAIYQRRT